jgi:hypothetical protein
MNSMLLKMQNLGEGDSDQFTKASKQKKHLSDLFNNLITKGQYRGQTVAIKILENVGGNIDVKIKEEFNVMR